MKSKSCHSNAYLNGSHIVNCIDAASELKKRYKYAEISPNKIFSFQIKKL